MDSLMLTAGIVTSGLSLGAGIWKSLKGSPGQTATHFPVRGIGVIINVGPVREAPTFAVDVVVNGKATPLTIQQRDAVLQVLGEQQPARS